MKYLMLTPFGLSLELTKEQADEALLVGKRKFNFEVYGEGINKQVIFSDFDRWIYEIDIFDETHPLD